MRGESAGLVEVIGAAVQLVRSRLGGDDDRDRGYVLSGRTVRDQFELADFIEFN